MLETFVATSFEIRLMAFSLTSNCIDFRLQTLLSRRDAIRIITNDMQRNCAEYGYKLNLLQLNSSVLKIHLQTISDE